MFRSFLALIFILASTNLFAMPCPNGESACGKPNFYQVLESKTIKYKELKYGTQLLVFESNQLIDFK